MRAVLALRLRSQAATWAASLGTDRKYKRPVRHASRPHGDGGGLRARSVARRSGAQQGVAWCCGRLDLLMRSLGAEAPSDRPDFDPNKVVVFRMKRLPHGWMCGTIMNDRLTTTVALSLLAASAWCSGGPSWTPKRWKAAKQG